MQMTCLEREEASCPMWILVQYTLIIYYGRCPPVVPHCSSYTVWVTMTENPSPDVPPTVLSTLQATSIPDDISPSSLHPFSSSGEQTVALLHALLDTTELVAHSVTLHSTTLVNDSKTVSLLRQQSAGQHTLHLVNDAPPPCMILSQRSTSNPLIMIFTSLARRWRKP